MELRPYGIDVCVSFPPDTNTPMLAREASSASRIGSDLSELLNFFGPPYEPETIAAHVWKGVESRRHHIYHGFIGFALATLCSGMSPGGSLGACLLQVCGRSLGLPLAELWEEFGGVPLAGLWE